MEQRILKIVNNYLNTNIYSSYLETSGGQLWETVHRCCTSTLTFFEWQSEKLLVMQLYVENTLRQFDKFSSSSSTSFWPRRSPPDASRKSDKTFTLLASLQKIWKEGLDLRAFLAQQKWSCIQFEFHQQLRWNFTGYLRQGTLNDGEGSAQLTSLYRPIKISCFW